MGIIDLPGVRLRFSRQKLDDLTREHSWPAIPDQRWRRVETPEGLSLGLRKVVPLQLEARRS